MILSLSNACTIVWFIIVKYSEGIVPSAGIRGGPSRGETRFQMQFIYFYSPRKSPRVNILFRGPKTKVAPLIVCSTILLIKD